MARTRNKRKYFACDFETTVEEDEEIQQETEVWSGAYVEISSPQKVKDLQKRKLGIHCNNSVTVETSIRKFFSSIHEHINSDTTLYFHNLKFDGDFILSYFTKNPKMKEGFIDNRFKEEDELENGEYIYLISDMGAWYYIKYKYRGHIVTILDSLKLMPMALSKLGKAFKTPHQKLEMKYDTKHFENSPISKNEMEYIKNDVLVLKECLEKMFSMGMSKITIGACCLSEYKQIMGKENFENLFPQLAEIDFPFSSRKGIKNVEQFIRFAYRGGWCYCDERKQGKICGSGRTYDVNSLYPSVMYDKEYPYGKPVYIGTDLPDFAKNGGYFYYVEVNAVFDLKPKHLPFIQVKNDIRFFSTDMLKSSNPFNNTRFKKDFEGNGFDSLNLIMTGVDYKLFHEHYEVKQEQIISCVVFKAKKGLFKDYIDKWKSIKIKASKEKNSALRQLAKLMLNNLYGKMAMSDNSSFKLYRLNNDGIREFLSVEVHDRLPAYIAIGAAITSYARDFTIRAAQENYDVFRYADTDSIHIECKEDYIAKGIIEHEDNFSCWKNETKWKKAIFTRAKTYIEVLTEQDGEQVVDLYLIKGCGLSTRGKAVLLASMGDKDSLNYLMDKQNRGLHAISEQEQKFINEHHTLSDYNRGLTVPSGKLTPVRVRGGLVLVEKDFNLR